MNQKAYDEYLKQELCITCECSSGYCQEKIPNVLRKDMNEIHNEGLIIISHSCPNKENEKCIIYEEKFILAQGLD